MKLQLLRFWNYINKQHYIFKTSVIITAVWNSKNWSTTNKYDIKTLEKNMLILLSKIKNVTKKYFIMSLNKERF